MQLFFKEEGETVNLASLAISTTSKSMLELCSNRLSTDGRF